MNSKIRQQLIVALCVVTILAACGWIYFAELKAAKYNVGLHQRVGEVLAEQTAAVVGKKGLVVTIAMPTREWPELKTEMRRIQVRLAEARARLSCGSMWSTPRTSPNTA